MRRKVTTMTAKWIAAAGIALALVGGGLAAVVRSGVRADHSAVQQEAAARRDALGTLPAHVGRPFPPARFTAPGGATISNGRWREGKVVLVLLTTQCDACIAEATFLRTLIGKRRDVQFLGVLSFEQDEQALRRAQELFPFAVVRDEHMELMSALRISGVPVKIYLEDGVVKRFWGGASLQASAREAFTDWLSNV
jgi:hypothetical protein